MKVVDDGKKNPLIVISADELARLLWERVEAAGYGDRNGLAVQCTFEAIGGDPEATHWHLPEITLMVSPRPTQE